MAKTDVAFIHVVQLLSQVWLLRPHGLQHATVPSLTTSRSLFRLVSIESVMLSSYLILCRPLLLLPLIFPTIRVFSNELSLRIRWPKYWSFSISPFNEYSRLISFRFDWFALLAILRDSQESSLTPQFRSINFLSFNFLYGLTLTSIHDYWKNHI